MANEVCLLCKGTGQVEHPMRFDDKGHSYVSIAEIHDVILIELKNWCLQNPEASLPVSKIKGLLDEVWQLTYTVLAYTLENDRLKHVS